jgi:hypothetical protein
MVTTVIKGITAIELASLINGRVDVYANLPTPGLSNKDDIYYVAENSGGSWDWRTPLKTVYAHPKGTYISDGITWESIPLQVTFAEDAATLVNIQDGEWTNFLSIGVDINIKDVLVYDGILYRNTTGTTISTAPDLDATNWEEVVEDPIPYAIAL